MLPPKDEEGGSGRGAGDGEGEKEGNTVVAAFVVLETAEGGGDEEGGGDAEGARQRKRLRAVAMGKGTKVCSHRIIAANGDGRRLHDMHAEVLARRSLMRVLYAELLRGGGSLIERCDGGTDPHPRFRWRRGVSLHMYISSAPCGNATLKRWATSRKETFLDALDEWTWPCAPPPGGDVCDERRGRGEGDGDEPGAVCRPATPGGWSHEEDRFTSFAAREGQVAALVKRDPDVAMLKKLQGAVNSAGDREDDAADGGGADARRPCEAEAEAAARSQIERLEREFDASPLAAYPQARAGTGAAEDLEAVLSDRNIVPAGTSIPGMREGCVLTCSDKLAVWNCIGLQGALLSRFVRPVYVDTITVGRKFSQAHMRRAVCCRMQSFDVLLRHRRREAGAAPDGEGAVLPRVRHPTLMCTNVMLDDGEVDRDEPASFDSILGESWAEGDGERAEKVSAVTGAVVAVDGGALPADAASKISKRMLFARYVEVVRKLGVGLSGAAGAHPPFAAGEAAFMEAYLREKRAAGRLHHEGRAAIHHQMGIALPQPAGAGGAGKVRHKRVPRLLAPGEFWPHVGYVRKRDYFWGRADAAAAVSE